MNRPGPAEVDERIADWVDERMTPRERDRFEAEMRVNARLRAQAEGYQRLVRGLRSLRDAEADPVDVRARVVAALQQPHKPRSPIRAERPSRPALAASGVVAAAALVLVSLLSQWQPAVGVHQDLARAATPPTDATGAIPKPGSAAADAAPRSGVSLAAESGSGGPLASTAAGADRLGDPGIGTTAGLPSSVVPQITIAFAKAPASKPPIAGGGGGGVAAEELKRSSAAFDWKALAAGLQVEALTGVPLPVAKLDTWDDGSSGATAYLVEGAKADITAFLRRLGEAAQTQGFEVRNGEADAQSVTAMVPAVSVTPSNVEGVLERVRSKAKAASADSGANPFVRLVVVVHTQPR